MKKWFMRWWFTVLDWAYIFWRQFLAVVAPGDPRQYGAHIKAGRVPVILIPGIYEPWFIMKPLADVLAGQGYPVHIIEGLGYNTGEVAAMALIVRHYIDAEHLTDAVIVAHSKGGLIGKYVLANHNSDGAVRHMVAINAPFAGSAYAYFAPIRGVRIFTPKGKLITELGANTQINTRITSVYSRYDPNIPSSSRLDGAKNVPVQAIGHFRILNDTETQKAVLDALATIKPAGAVLP